MRAGKTAHRTLERLLRGGLVALAVPNWIVGAWLLFSPRSFYTGFPGAGHRWVASLGLYNEHAFTDFGGALLALALLTSLAAAWLEYRLVQAALLAVLLESVAHFIYHLTQLSALSAGDDVANQLSLAYGVVGSILLLALNRKVKHAAPQATPASGAAQGGETIGPRTATSINQHGR